MDYHLLLQVREYLGKNGGHLDENQRVSSSCDTVNVKGNELVPARGVREIGIVSCILFHSVYSLLVTLQPVALFQQLDFHNHSQHIYNTKVNHFPNHYELTRKVTTNLELNFDC